MYQITLNSFEMGKFRYEASAGRNKYVADSEVAPSALFGAVTWNGATRSSDGIKRELPNPTSYEFDFQDATGGGAH